MFVLHETYKAVQQSDSPYMGVMLAAVLIVIVVYAVWALTIGRKK